MKKAVLLLFFIFPAFWATAQIEFGSNDLTTESTPFLCRPGVHHKSPGKGVAIHYTFNPDFYMKAPSGLGETKQEVKSNHRFGGKLKVPILNRNNVKFMFGFKYAVEKYDFEDIDPENDLLFKHLNSTTLRKSEAAAYLILPINHKYYTSFRFSAGFQGDYDGFVNMAERFAVYRAVGMFGVKKNENLEYGLGVVFSKNIRQRNVLPFGFFNYTINDKWGIEAAVPARLKVRHNFAEGKIALLGLEYSSQNYSLDLGDPNNTVTPSPGTLFLYRRSSLQLTGSYMHQISDWTWMEFKLGYVFDFNSEARDFREMQTYDLQPSGSILGTVTFFISPPKKFLNNCKK